MSDRPPITLPTGASAGTRTQPARNCQPCTACCDGWLRIQVNGRAVLPGRPCPHSTGSGCNDYAHRPFDPCVMFHCGWRIDNSPLPEWMKPDNSKVIVLLSKASWRGVPVDLAVPVGRRIPPRALNWLKQFAQKHGRALVYSEQVVESGQYTGKQDYFAYGPPEFQQEIAERANRNEWIW